ASRRGARAAPGTPARRAPSSRPAPGPPPRRPRRVGALGGSSDPPHIGHLALAEAAMAQLDLDEVRFVPTGHPPHRPDAALPPDVRAAMVARMVEERPEFVLSRAELDRPGPSYTADTVEAFAVAEPNADLWLILGADQLATFDRWHEPGRILARARIAAAARGEADADLVAHDAERLAPGRRDLIRM